MFTKSFCARVKNIRDNKGFSQKKITELSGINQSFLSKVEQGKSIPSSDFLKVFYLLFDTDINWLLTGEGAMNIEKKRPNFEDNETPGQRLKKIRNSFDFTQDEFGKKLEVTHSFISQIEKDKNSMGAEFLYELNRQLNVNINWLLAGEGAMFLTGVRPAAESDAVPDQREADQPGKDQSKEKSEFTPDEVRALKDFLGSLNNPNMINLFAAISKKAPDEIDALKALCDAINKPYMKSIVTMADGMSDEERNNLFAYIEEQKRLAEVKRKLGGGGTDDLPEVKRA